MLSIAIVSVLLACGGKGGNNSVASVDPVGKWRGVVYLDPETCTFDSEDGSYLDLDGQEFTLDLEPLSENNAKFVKDNLGNIYSEHYEEGIPKGSFYASRVGVDESPPHTPTGVQFDLIDDSNAEVYLIVYYNRFCATHFIGNFERLASD